MPFFPVYHRKLQKAMYTCLITGQSGTKLPYLSFKKEDWFTFSSKFSIIFERENFDSEGESKLWTEKF